ncbi:unnamed protein product, partial [Leptidea sinapis]
MFTEQEFKLRYRFDKNTVLHIMSRVVQKVSKEIAKLGRIYISMPNYEDTRDVKPQFFKISGLVSMVVPSVFLLSIMNRKSLATSMRSTFSLSVKFLLRLMDSIF